MRVCLDIRTELQKAISLRAVTNKYLAFVSAAGQFQWTSPFGNRGCLYLQMDNFVLWVMYLAGNNININLLKDFQL